MIEIIGSLITTIYFCLMFLFFLPELPRWYYNLGLACFVFVMVHFVVPIIAQAGTVIYIFVPSIAIYIYSKKVYYSIFTLVGYLLGIMLNYIYTPLISAIFSVDAFFSFLELYSLRNILLLLLLVTFTGLTFWPIRRIFISRNMFNFPDMPIGLQVLALIEIIFSMLLIAANFMLEDYLGYPPVYIRIVGVLALGYALIVIVTFYNLQRISQENLRFRLQKQELQDVQEFLKQTEDNYTQMRQFRHDYHNVMATLGGYIDDNDTEALREYYNEKILPLGDITFDKEMIVSRLGNIKIPEIKGLLYSKILKANKFDILPTFECIAPIETINMDTLLLARILGIMVDNAVEAAAETDEKRVDIVFVDMDNSVVIIIKNSTKPLPMSIEQLVKKGVTTKEGHAGMGTTFVVSTVDKLDNARFSLECVDNVFVQKLEIGKEEV